MLEAVIIGSGRSTPGLFSSRRRILRWRRFNWRRTLAFTRKPPGGEQARVVKHLDCSRKPGGFRVPRPQHASNYAWLRVSTVEAQSEAVLWESLPGHPASIASAFRQWRRARTRKPARIFRTWP